MHYDFIILDEIESLLAHLSSPTLSTKRNIVCLIIQQLLKNAKWVLSLDADFGQRSYEFLSLLLSPPKLVINNCLTTKRKFLFTSKYETRCHQLLEDIKNKKNVAVVCLRAFFLGSQLPK